jgi:hypothetical protein
LQRIARVIGAVFPGKPKEQVDRFVLAIVWVNQIPVTKDDGLSHTTRQARHLQPTVLLAEQQRRRFAYNAPRAPF